jgi:hypothetical protein
MPHGVDIHCEAFKIAIKAAICRGCLRYGIGIGAKKCVDGAWQIEFSANLICDRGDVFLGPRLQLGREPFAIEPVT